MRYRFGEDAALLVECCGAPAHWAGDEEAHTSVLCKIRKRWKNLGQPVIVLACPTCASLLTEAIPEAPIIFLWELIANHGFHPDQSGQGKTVFVFDPCAGKAFPNAKQSVRQLLEGKEYAIEEVPENPGRAQCCGYGGLVWPTNTKVVESIAEMEINQSNKDYITWCSNCRDIFVSRGKRAAHILDILMAPFEDRFKRPAPNLTERRKNRQALCAKLCEPSSEGLQGDSEGQRNLVLVVPPAVQKKMDQNLILEDHIRVVIESAENGGLLVKNPSTGLLTSYLKQGALTYWVQYKREDDGRICVCNVYTHRMSIVEKR